MSRQSLFTGTRTAQDAGITENGLYRLYESDKVNTQQSDTSIEAVIKYTNSVPDAEQNLVKYQLFAELETEDGDGSWSPFHYQFQSFVKSENGATHSLIMSPSIFNLDEGVPNYLTAGGDIIAVEHRKQGSLPDDFRVAVLVKEAGFGEPGAFQACDLSVSYRVYGG